jgi:hypothetical protein
MAKAFEPDQLATRAFAISVIGIAAFIAVVFIFIL